MTREFASWVGSICLVTLVTISEAGAQPNDGPFSFCLVKYSNNGWDEPLGFGWATDWPDAGYGLMLKLDELTEIEIEREADGTPKQVALSLTDPQLSRHPIVFMSDVGTAGFDADEEAALRAYLLGGGVLHVDDFWGETAWKNWAYTIGRVLPPDEYPIVELAPGHPVFNEPFQAGNPPQVPSIQFWAATNGESSFERGEAHPVHYRGINDKNGRLMVFMSYNTDLGDAWEVSLTSEDSGLYRTYRDRFCEKALGLAFNLIAYARRQ